MSNDVAKDVAEGVAPPLGVSSHIAAACDQCRLKKVKCNRKHPACANCQQYRLECTWMNKGKKLNQVKRLADDFETLGSRFCSLETRVEELSAAILELSARLSKKDSPRATRAAESIDVLSQSRVILDRGSSSRTVGNDTIPAQLSYYILAGEGGQRSHQGPSSVISLLLQSDGAIDSSLHRGGGGSFRDLLLRPTTLANTAGANGGEPSWSSFFLYKDAMHLELSKALGSKFLLLDTSSDDSPLLRPPRPLLESLLDGYFHHIDPVTPLLNRESVLDAIQPCYEAEPEQADLGWVVLFNYIVIRCLAGRHVLEQPVTDVNVVAGSQFDQPFVVNIRRAFRHLESLTKPSLTNVQALGALTILAQKYFSINTAQMLFDRTCYLAQQIGLHRQSQMDRLSRETSQDLEPLFWLLYTIDKNISLLLGVSPRIPLYDCDVPMPTSLLSEQTQRVQACIIQERIYVMLYSASGTQKTQEQREQAVNELEADLDQFRSLQDEAEHEDSMTSWRGKPFLKLELKFIYHQLRVMVFRCSTDPAKKLLCLEEARESITNMSKIRRARTTIGGSMVLRRPFQWHSFTPFFELYSSVFKYPLTRTQLEDFGLLKNCVSMLREVAGLDGPSTYCATLLSITTTCIDIAQNFIHQCQQGGGLQPSPSCLPMTHSKTNKRKRSEVEKPAAAEHSFEPNHPQRLRLASAAEQQQESWQPNLSSQPICGDNTIEYGTNSINTASATLDPFYWYSEAGGDAALQLTDDLMWGGHDILADLEGSPT